MLPLCTEIERLGGHVINVPHFDPTCTHVVVGRPSRGEKYLAACAAGKWYAGDSCAATTALRATTVDQRLWGGEHSMRCTRRILTPQFVTESARRGRFVAEAPYEWSEHTRTMDARTVMQPARPWRMTSS